MEFPNMSAKKVELFVSRGFRYFVVEYYFGVEIVRSKHKTYKEAKKKSSTRNKTVVFL